MITETDILFLHTYLIIDRLLLHNINLNCYLPRNMHSLFNHYLNIAPIPRTLHSRLCLNLRKLMQKYYKSRSRFPELPVKHTHTLTLLIRTYFRMAGPDPNKNPVLLTWKPNKSAPQKFIYRLLKRFAFSSRHGRDNEVLQGKHHNYDYTESSTLAFYQSHFDTFGSEASRNTTQSIYYLSVCIRNGTAQ